MRLVVVSAAVVALSGCGASKRADPKAIADCIQTHGGTALVSPDPKTDAQGIPGNVTSAVDFSVAGPGPIHLEVGTILVERSATDADRAASALRHLDPKAVKVPGVDLSMLPVLDAIKTGQAERHGAVIVLWGHDRTDRTAEASTVVRSCLSS